MHYTLVIKTCQQNIGYDSIKKQKAPVSGCPLNNNALTIFFYLATKNMAANSTPIIQVPMFISFILPVNIFTKI